MQRKEVWRHRSCQWTTLSANILLHECRPLQVTNCPAVEAPKKEASMASIKQYINLIDTNQTQSSQKMYFIEIGEMMKPMNQK